MPNDSLQVDRIQRNEGLYDRRTQRLDMRNEELIPGCGVSNFTVKKDLDWFHLERIPGPLVESIGAITNFHRSIYRKVLR